MKSLTFLTGCAFLTLAACSEIPSGNSSSENKFIEELPENVIVVVATNQDLRAVKIEQSDGCYVYRHVGPVETTFLPLRTINGRPICTVLPEST